MSIGRRFRADSSSLLLSALRRRLTFAVPALFAIAFIQHVHISSASAASLTLSVPSAALTVNLDSNVDNGFAKSSQAQVKVKTDSSHGYELGIKAKTDNNLSSGSNNLEPIAAGEGISEESFKSDAQYMNKWAYLPTKLNGSANDKFFPAPKSSPSVIEKTKTSNSAENIYGITIAARVNSSFPPGVYSNTFTITGITNDPPVRTYSITYDLNGGSGGSNSTPKFCGSIVNPQTGSTTEDRIKLQPITADRNYYRFQGWCTEKTSDENCSGEVYTGKGEEYLPLRELNNQITLYAMWLYYGCFVAGTLVETPTGLKPIETIASGDSVYAYDFTSGAKTIDTVKEMVASSRSDIVKLSLEDDSAIQGTSGHLFYDWNSHKWNMLGNFQVGDTLSNSIKPMNRIKSLEPVSGQRYVYNLQTENHDNYYIATSKDQSFLVLGLVSDEQMSKMITDDLILQNNAAPMPAYSFLCGSVPDDADTVNIEN